MDKKNILILLVAGFLLMASLGVFVSAQSGCCLKTNDGAWCQMTEQSECSVTVAPTSCDSFSQCVTGTCINSNSGQCSQNVPKATCEANGGIWDPRPKSDVELNGVHVCQNGCCSLGENVAFVSQTECRRLASDYGVESTFDGSITSEVECLSLGSSEEEGACVFDRDSNGESGNSGGSQGGFLSGIFGGGENNSEASVFGLAPTCRRMTKEECNALPNSNFEPGMLCTAPFLGTDCAPSENTMCGDGDKVYFVDTCGNKANIYDENMFSKNPRDWNPEVRDYWTKIQDPKCNLATSPSGCGDCNILAGNICRTYSGGVFGMPSHAPKYGDKVCASMDCEYDGKRYKHGESWCAETDGTFHHLTVDPLTGEFDSDTLKKLKDPNLYNLPGSRYVMLSCYDGEVIEEPCREYRNEICLESSYPDTDYKVAKCVINDWRSCITITNKGDCEDLFQCKWIPGYRFDGQIVTTQHSRNQEEQGSCVPLFAPGFDFWNPEGDGAQLCSSLSLNQQAVYETHFSKSRDSFQDLNLKEAAQRCIQDCYLIPGYGKDVDLQKYINFWEGGDYGQDLDSFSVSLRKGYYCAGQGGGFSDGKINCAGDPDKSSVFPIFLTHKEWITSITDRTRSMGDCGYKQSAYRSLGVEPINKELELVTVMFQRLNQDGTPKDGNGTSEKIYVAGEYIGDKEGNYRDRG